MFESSQSGHGHSRSRVRLLSIDSNDRERVWQAKDIALVAETMGTSLQRRILRACVEQARRRLTLARPSAATTVMRILRDLDAQRSGMISSCTPFESSQLPQHPTKPTTAAAACTQSVHTARQMLSLQTTKQQCRFDASRWESRWLFHGAIDRTHNCPGALVLTILSSFPCFPDYKP